MKEESKNSLNQCLLQLVSACDLKCGEEQGAFIIQREGVAEYEAYWVTNINSGTPRASGLYTANRDEYGEKILKKVLTGDWFEYASFHTHPRGFGSYPSIMDLRQLFTGFPINYIYAPDMELLMRYNYDKEHIWLATPINLITHPSTRLQSQEQEVLEPSSSQDFTTMEQSEISSHTQESRSISLTMT